jgi:hypothetical protein
LQVVRKQLKPQGRRIHHDNSDSRTKAVNGNHKIPIPMHGDLLGKGTACKILSEAGYGIDDFIEWRRQ